MDALRARPRAAPRAETERDDEREDDAAAAREQRGRGRGRRGLRRERGDGDCEAASAVGGAAQVGLSGGAADAGDGLRGPRRDELRAQHSVVLRRRDAALDRWPRRPQAHEPRRRLGPGLPLRLRVPVESSARPAQGASAARVRARREPERLHRGAARLRRPLRVRRTLLARAPRTARAHPPSLISFGPFSAKQKEKQRERTDSRPPPRRSFSTRARTWRASTR